MRLTHIFLIFRSRQWSLRFWIFSTHRCNFFLESRRIWLRRYGIVPPEIIALASVSTFFGGSLSVFFFAPIPFRWFGFPAFATSRYFYPFRFSFPRPHPHPTPRLSLRLRWGFIIPTVPYCRLGIFFIMEVTQYQSARFVAIGPIISLYQGIWFRM